jgi:hypothetical protein
MLPHYSKSEGTLCKIQRPRPMLSTQSYEEKSCVSSEILSNVEIIGFLSYVENSKLLLMT